MYSRFQQTLYKLVDQKPILTPSMPLVQQSADPVLRTHSLSSSQTPASHHIPASRVAVGCRRKGTHHDTYRSMICIQDPGALGPKLWQLGLVLRPVRSLHPWYCLRLPTCRSLISRCFDHEGVSVITWTLGARSWDSFPALRTNAVTWCPFVMALRVICSPQAPVAPKIKIFMPKTNTVEEAQAYLTFCKLEIGMKCNISGRNW